ncbi:hypothetical protein C0J09_15225 [Bordetella avium]|nr:hypothetical protein C0J09_15225 [Bordetella avium]
MAGLLQGLAVMTVRDWAQWYALGEERLQFIRQLEGFYVLVHGGASITTRAHHHLLSPRYRDDPRFLGYCLIGEGFFCPWLREVRWPGEGQYLSLPDVLQKQMRSGGKIGLLTFSGTSEEDALLRRFKPWSFDYLAYLAERDLPFLYGPLQKEREFIRANLDRYLQLVSAMDLRSQETMYARLAATFSLDRQPLMRTLTPFSHMYFNPVNEDDSFVPKPRENYVDVGATQGSELLRFISLVQDVEGSRFWAIEPNAVDYALLKQLRFFASFRPLRVIVSDRNQEGLAFFTDPGCRDGSRLVSDNTDPAWLAANAAHIERLPCVTLDTQVQEPITFLKVDVEGAELSVLCGATRHVSQPECRIAVAAYHYPQDVLELADFFVGLGRKRLRLRQHDPSLWDLILYVDDVEGDGAG